MTSTVEPFYRSSNGDGWSLVGKADGSVVVRHEANAPAGGAITETGLAEFLARDGHGPEYQILASLVSTTPDFQFLDRRTTAPSTVTAHASAGQFRAARGLLGWSVERAASEAGIDVEIAKALERGMIGPSGADNIDERRLIRAFETGGIAFINDGAVSIGGSGVRLIATGTFETGEGEGRDDGTNDNDEEVLEAKGVSR